MGFLVERATCDLYFFCASGQRKLSGITDLLLVHIVNHDDKDYN